MFRASKTALARSAAVAALVAGAAPSAFAQSAGSTAATNEPVSVGELIVTAQKREQRLIEVPAPVTALSASSLLESNQTRIQDYYTRIPALNVTPSVQGQQNLTIRGITTGFANPTVGVTIDDVPYGSSGNRPSGLMAPDLDPADLARIEVLRGPQGTLYGASSLGGLFKYVTVDPSTEAFSGRVQAGVSAVENGEKLGHILRGMVNVPISDSVAVRVSAFSRGDPGYIDNVMTGEGAVNDARLKGARVAVFWRPSGAFDLKLSGYHQDDEGDGQSEVDHLPGLGELEQRRVRGSGDFDRELTALSAVAHLNVGALKFTSVTGHTLSITHDNFDFTGSFGPGLLPLYGVVGVPVITDSQVKRFTQEIRVDVPLGERADLMAGGFYSDEATDFDQVIPAVDINTGLFVAPSRIVNNGPLNVKEKAVFGSFTYRFTEQFDVLLGGRYSRISQNIEAGTAQRFPPAGNGQVTVSPAVRAEPDDVFTYLVNPRFKWSETGMIYARASSGYRIGGGGSSSPNDNCVLFNFPCQFGPDKTYNYEVGAKGELFDRMLTYDVSLYYIDWKDIQIQGFSAPFTYNTNGSRAKSQGIEVSFEAHPTQALTLSTWAAFNDAVLTEPLPTGTASMPVAGSGDRLPLSARWSGNVSADYEFELTDELSGSVRGSVSYLSSRPGLFTPAGTARVTYPEYAKVDLLARLTHRDLSLDLYVNNLFDKRVDLSGGPGFFPPESASILMPRTVGVSLSATF